MVYTDGVYLMSDDEEELHKFAKIIGLGKDSLRKDDKRCKYFLDTPGKASKALYYGAKNKITHG